MRSENKIDIGTVLNKLDIATSDDSEKVKTFGIRFVTRDGRVREIYDARKNVKLPRESGEGSSKRGKSHYNLKFHGTVKLYDENTEEYRDVKKAHMIQFREHNTTFWKTIFH